MIKPLRKYHFIGWRVIAVVLPLAFIFALVFRPARSKTKTFDKDCFIQTMRSTDSTIAISIAVLNPIRVPNCLVYAKVNGQNLLVGNIATTATYSFDAPASTSAIVLFDKIHNVELKSQALEPNKQTP